MPDRPNILLITTDQQSAAAMSCAGNAYLQTPAMDSLAASGTRFDNAYCTYPLCTPSRASWFTGRWPHEVGIDKNGKGIDDAFREQELGTLLKAAGCDCAYGGKWHVPEIAMPDGHGFETICGFNDVELPAACETFLSAKRDKPFFLTAHFDNPHNICEWVRSQPLPWGNLPDPPDPGDCPALPDNHEPCPDEASAITAHRNEFIRYGIIYTHRPERWRQVRWAYYRLVEKVDAQIGRILSALAESPHAQKTVVVFTSDHGDQAGAHTLGQKWTFFDESARIPLIVRDGRNPGGRVAEHLVSNGPDMFRTICDYAGVEVPEGICGHSLRPIVEGREVQTPNEYVAAETMLRAYGECSGRMIRSKRFKYNCYGRGVPREELYDLESDPGETVNLAERPEHRETLLQHREYLRQWCTATHDTFGGRHYAHGDTPFMLPGDGYDT